MLLVDSISIIRDIIIELLYNYNLYRFPQAGLRGVLDCFNILLDGLPQISYTFTHIYKCAAKPENAYYRTTRAGKLKTWTMSSLLITSSKLDSLGISWDGKA